MVKWVKCIENFKYPDLYLSRKNKIYKVLREDKDHYFIHDLEIKEEDTKRFIELKENIKILEILYGK